MPNQLSEAAKPQAQIVIKPCDNDVKPSSMLWTDRFAPKTLSDLVGNKREIEAFYDWLKDWDNVHIKGNKKE